MLELPRGGKIRAQDAAVARRRGEIVAFSDANALWEPDALRALVAPFADPRVGYVCGQVALRQRRRHQPGGRLLALRDGAARAASRAWRSVTAGNGAIYATRRDAYIEVDPSWATTSRSRSTWSSAAGARVYAPGARASEKMVPSIEGEFARKRRMMSHAWPIVLRGGHAVAARLPARATR